jgi:hypothetical protein
LVLPRTVCRLPLVVRRSPFAVRRLPLAAHCSLLSAFRVFALLCGFLFAVIRGGLQRFELI